MTRLSTNAKSTKQPPTTQEAIDLKDISPPNPRSHNSQPPVTRWQPIDALAQLNEVISKLYVIRNEPTQLKTTLNKPRKPCC
ncbi:MAG: hypothetical protein ACRCZS_21675 [Chroococcidiopsis sp.]